MVAYVPQVVRLEHDVVVQQPLIRREVGQPVVVQHEGVATAQHLVSVEFRHEVSMALANLEYIAQSVEASSSVLAPQVPDVEFRAHDPHDKEQRHCLGSFTCEARI